MTAAEQRPSWYFDSGDPSVGIWPSWVHDDCTVADEALAHVEAEVAARHEGTGHNRVLVRTLRLRCDECGLGTEVEARDADPEYVEAEA